jgi:hypothetical protein
MRRLLVLALLLVLLAASPAAAQDANPFDDGLPSPTPTAVAVEDDDTDATTVWIIAGGALVLIIGLGLFITRDARRNLTPEDRAAVESGRVDDPLRDDERMTGGKTGKQKSKARKKGKAQRQARKANRPR